MSVLLSRYEPNDCQNSEQCEDASRRASNDLHVKWTEFCDVSLLIASCNSFNSLSRRALSSRVDIELGSGDSDLSECRAQ